MSSRYLQQVLRLFGQVTDRLPCVLSPAYSASSLANSPRSSPSQSPSLDLLASAAEITEANNNNNNNIHDFDAPHASVQLPDPSHCLEVLLHWQRILSATPDGMPVPNTDYTRLTQNLDPNRLADNPTYLSYVRAEVRRQTMILLGFDPKFAKSVRKSAPPPECFLLGVAHLLHFANARSSTEFVATITNLRAAIADLTALTDTFGVTPALDSVAQHLPLLSEPRSFLAIVKDFQGRWKDVKGPWQTSTTHLRKTFFHDALFDYFPFMQPPVGSGWTKEAKEVYMLTQLEGLVNVGAGLVPDATEPLSFERTLGNLLGTLQFAMAQYHALRKALAPMANVGLVPNAPFDIYLPYMSTNLPAPVLQSAVAQLQPIGVKRLYDWAFWFLKKENHDWAPGCSQFGDTECIDIFNLMCQTHLNYFICYGVCDGTIAQVKCDMQNIYRHNNDHQYENTENDANARNRF